MPLLAAAPVTVSLEERAVLEGLVHAHSTPQQLSTRARLILQPICSARIPNQTIEHRAEAAPRRINRREARPRKTTWRSSALGLPPDERESGGRPRTVVPT